MRPRRYHVLCLYAHEASGPKQQLTCPMCRDDTTYRRQLRQVRRDLKDVLGMGAGAAAWDLVASPAQAATASGARAAGAEEAPLEAPSPLAVSAPARAHGNSAEGRRRKAEALAKSGEGDRQVEAASLERPGKKTRRQ